MPVLEYRTAGESHGRALIALVEGMPADVAVDVDFVNAELGRRQGGYGRGGRMKIEQDSVNILSGVRRGLTLGSPIALQILNRDFSLDEAPGATGGSSASARGQRRKPAQAGKLPVAPLHRPRPGHADLAGSLKWLTTDCRQTLERASARETAARVAAGALVRCLLSEFDIDVVGYVVRVGDVLAETPSGARLDELRAARDANEMYCPDAAAAERMIEVVRQAEVDKDTAGGVIEVQVHGHPPGLGSCMRWQDKLDGRLMQAVGSIQAIKGVEIGLGFGAAKQPGSTVHDEILFDPGHRDTPNLGFVRRSNNAGGLEGGMTNGEPIVLRAAMKPISTLRRGLESVNLLTKAPERSDYERSDVCAVPAASVVAEDVVAFEIARAFLDKFAGDTLREVRAAYESYLEFARSLGESGPSPT